MYSYIISSPVILIGLTYVVCSVTASSVKWPTKEQELLDEIHDAEILKAVQHSMYEYEMANRNHRRKRATEKKVCYDEVGCFEDSGPFSYLEMLPASPDEINTKFYFHSTKDRSDKPLLELPFHNISSVWEQFDNEINRSDDDKSDLISAEVPYIKSYSNLKKFEGLDKLSVRVIVHGFGSSCSHVWIYEMRAALMAVEECIIICIDWENGAALPNYVKAAANTRLVGKQLAMLIKGLQQYKGLDVKRVHIIGFSLGAHVSGFAGSELSGVRRITGLDPAGPLFESQHPKVRLDNTDADFVDVVHSNGENLILGGLGSWQPMGDVDFYPNGGRVQHGCSNLFVGAVTDFLSPPTEIEGRSLCNHRRAYKFFIDSVAPRCLFPAFPCNSYEDFLSGKCFPCSEAEKKENPGKCGNMGYYADKSTGRGQLYLVTREEEPFCAHQYNLEIHSSESELPLRTMGKFEVVLEGDGGLNETFFVYDKDDTELFAGSVSSRIIVPHPALGFPSSITLTYKAYSGWLSKGLSMWTIHKVVLTDSFGKSYSVCKRYFELESGKSIHLHLKPGLCQVPEENFATHSPFSLGFNETSMSNDTESKATENSLIDSIGNYDYENYGLHQLNKNRNNLLNIVDSTENDLRWHPIVDQNGIDKSGGEISRSFPETDDAKREIFEPILKGKHYASGRSNGDKFKRDNGDEEILEPVLRSTTPNARRMKNVPFSDELASRENPEVPKEKFPFAIQLLPFRIGDLFERAERYARETLWPLISEEAPKFLNIFNFNPNRDEEKRYFPPLGELNSNNSDVPLARSTGSNLPPGMRDIQIDLDDVDYLNGTYGSENSFEGNTTKREIPPDSTNNQNAPRTGKNILESLREKDNKPQLVDRISQSSESGKTKTEFDEGGLFPAVRIQLPTYQPPPKSIDNEENTTALPRRESKSSREGGFRRFFFPFSFSSLFGNG